MTRQFATFHVGPLYCGVPALAVQEIVRHQRMTPIPLAPRVIAGLLNLRGEVVPALDLRRRFGLPPAAESAEPPMNVVIRSSGNVISLLVDQIGDVLDIGEELFEPPPETLVGSRRALLSGVYKLPEGLLLSLDIEKTLDLVEAAQ